MAQKSSTISGCGRVDTHHHFLTKSVPALEVDLTAGGPLPVEKLPKGPQDHLDHMDQYGIQTAVISIPVAEQLGKMSPAEALAACEQAWKEQLTYVELNPLRFGSFAMLPLPNPDETLKFIESSVKSSIAPDGFQVGTSIGERYLGDPIFDPVWAALDKIHAPIFVHPIETAMPPNLNTPAFIMEYTFDTSRTIMSLILSGVFTRYPNVRFIFSHYGGVYPYIWHRAAPIEELIKSKNNSRTSRELMKTANIFFDTALSDPSQYSVVKDLGLPVEHMVYGSDHPFSTAPGIEHFKLGAESPGLSGVLSDEECNIKIARENALNLFPRLKKLYKKAFPEYYN